MTLAWRWKVLTNVSTQKLIALENSCLKILKNRLPRKAKHLDYDFPIFFIDLFGGIYFAAFLANWVLFKLCFLANLRFFKNLGSIPFILIFCLVLGLRVGFLWCFRFWLWLVWFLDLAILRTTKSKEILMSKDFQNILQKMASYSNWEINSETLNGF